MRTIRGDPMAAVFYSTALALSVLLGSGTAVTHAATVEKELPELTIQVAIKNMAFQVTGYGREGNPTAIVVCNDDGVTHGFYSPLFKDTPVRLEGDAYQVAGKDGPAFRVDPGKTMTLHFYQGVSDRPAHDGESAHATCDLVRYAPGREGGTVHHRAPGRVTGRVSQSKGGDTRKCREESSVVEGISQEEDVSSSRKNKGG